MTIASTTSKVSYNGSGSNGPFPITYKFTKNADITATKRSSLGVETVLALTTDYTLTGAGDAAGGALTLTVALAVGESLVIARAPRIVQEVDYVENSAFPAETHESALDLLTTICQSLQEQIDRAVKMEISSTTSPEDLLAEIAVDVAGAAAAVDAAETAQGLAEDARDATIAAAASVPTFGAFGLTLAATTTASNARTALGLVIGTNVLAPNGDGSQLTNLPSTSDQTARDQIALINLRLLLNSSVASGALIQGRMWELLTDEWGATSTNEAYISGAPGYYSNQSRSTTSSPAREWTTYGTQIALTQGQWVSPTTNSGVAHGYNSAALTGDFDFTYTISASSSSSDGGIQFGVSTAALATTNPSLYEAGNGTASWWFSHAGIGSNRTITLWNKHTSLATVTGVTIAAGDIFAIKRRGAVLTLWRNGTQIGTFTGFSSTAALYPIGGLYYASYTLTAVSWTLIGVLSTTTLISPTFTISAAGYLDAYFLYLDETGGAVAGTDFTVELSGDGGTNYYTSTLTTPLGASGFDGTYTMYKGRAAIAVTGTSPKARIVLNDTKVQRVAAPALYAE